MNLNMGQITKRAPRQFTRRDKASGALAAGSLADLQTKKIDRLFHFPKAGKQHECTWISGAYVKVCTQCGVTIDNQ